MIVYLHLAPTSRSAGLAVAGTDKQSAEPRLEPIGLAYRSNVEPGGQQRILDGIGGAVVIAQNQASRPEELVERGRRQLREGLTVTARGSY